MSRASSPFDGLFRQPVAEPPDSPELRADGRRGLDPAMARADVDTVRAGGEVL